MSNPSYQKIARVIVGQAGNLSKAERKKLKDLLDRFDDQPHIPFPSYSITVNYDQTVEQLIEAGKYDWFDEDVTSRHFPSNEKGAAELVVYLVNFKRDISSEDAIKELDLQGLRPPTPKELLSLGIAQPELQCGYSIVALGCTWRKSYGDVTLCLEACESHRYLHLRLYNNGWISADWQFAAVEKGDELAKK